MDIVKGFSAYVLSRLTEPSTWTSIGLAIVTIPSVHDFVVQAMPYIVPALAGLGAALPERKA